MRRNLLYNVWPNSANEEWRLNIEKLNTYKDVFNGRKIVLVKTGAGLVAPDVVEKALALSGVEVRRIPNDAAQQESAGFMEALADLKSIRSHEATFYAHNKGGRYYGAQEHQLYPIRLWRNTMYEKCLSDIDLIDRVLQENACCGCFRLRRSNYPTMLSPWHFSGTFWWFRHDALFSRDWTNMPGGIYGVENYLGNIFSLQESFCLHGDDSPPEGRYSALLRYKCSRRGCPAFLAETGVHLRARKLCPECGGPANVDAASIPAL